MSTYSFSATDKYIWTFIERGMYKKRKHMSEKIITKDRYRFFLRLHFGFRIRFHISLSYCLILSEKKKRIITEVGIVFKNEKQE